MGVEPCATWWKHIRHGQQVVAHIVIPVRDQLHLTRSIVDQLDQQVGWEKCWIFDNGSEDGTWDYLTELNDSNRRFHPIKAKGSGIYDMWGEGYKVAKAVGARYVGIFNNDLTLAPNTIDSLKDALAYNAHAWISYPDYDAPGNAPIGHRVTTGTYRHGGMSGFCFMLKTEPIDWEPLVDPQFKWWGGDDDIAFEVEKRGGQQVRVLGLPVTHLMEGTARHHDLGVQKGVDLEAVIKKWGR